MAKLKKQIAFLAIDKRIGINRYGMPAGVTSAVLILEVRKDSCEGFLGSFSFFAFNPEGDNIMTANKIPHFPTPGNILYFPAAKTDGLVNEAAAIKMPRKDISFYCSSYMVFADPL